MATFLAFLKAVPKFVDAFKLFDTRLEQLSIAITNAKYEGYKRKVEQVARRIENANTNDERRALAAELNSIG